MAPIDRHPVRGGPQGGALHPRIRLALLAALGRRRRQSEGTVMGIVLLAVLGVTLAAVAIANQIGSGAIRAPLMGQSREAREAADAGVMSVITELSKFENRRLLVADPQGGWSATQNNLCAATTAARDNGLWNTVTDDPLTPTAEALTLLDGTEEQIDATRRYVLQRVQLLNPDRRNSAWRNADGTSGSTNNYNIDAVNLFAPSIAQAESDSVGYIRLTVEGRYYQGANLVSTATVTREFQVVPKCCLRSFGPAWIPDAASSTGFSRSDDIFGPDRRNCNTPDAGANALGLVSFGGGVTKSAGTAMNIFTDTSDPPDNVGDENIAAVVCLSDSPCPDDGGLDGGAIPVIETQISLREVPSPPAGLGGTPTSTIYLPNSTYCTKSTTNEVYNSNPLAAPPVQEVAWLCKVDELPGDDVYISSSAETVDASGPLTGSASAVPVRLWVAGDISFTGNKSMQHCQNFDIQTNSCLPVNAFGPAPNYFDLHIYGNGVGGAAQSWELRGTTSALAAFFYAPEAACSVSGGGGATNNMLGQIWCNSFAFNGSVNLTTPPSDGAGGGAGGGGESVPPSIFDYVARSTWGSRMYGEN